MSRFSGSVFVVCTLGMLAFALERLDARPYSDAEIKAMFIRSAPPAYPFHSRRTLEEGRGVFRLFVNENGQ